MYSDRETEREPFSIHCRTCQKCIAIDSGVWRPTRRTNTHSVVVRSFVFPLLLRYPQPAPHQRTGEITHYTMKSYTLNRLPTASFRTACANSVELGITVGTPTDARTNRWKWMKIWKYISVWTKKSEKIGKVQCEIQKSLDESEYRYISMQYRYFRYFDFFQRLLIAFELFLFF